MGEASVSELASRLFMLVAEIALASKDVLIEKESFSELAKYLEQFRPILKELRDENIREVPTIHIALESLEKELKLGKQLIDTCSSKSRLYLLINCRNILKEVQHVTNEIGRCLSLIPISALDISLKVKEDVQSLQNAMMNAQFNVAVREEEILEKINTGIKDRQIDHEYANDMLFLIAKAVGIPVDPASLKQELEEFKKAKEYTELLKKESEAMELQQIIAFLSKADVQSAKQKEESSMVKSSCIGTQLLPPLQSFFCPITKAIMENPVEVMSGQTFECRAIEDWFTAGNKTCPITGMQLANRELKPNISLRKSICEWKERNTHIKIASIGRQLQQADDEQIVSALMKLQALSKENPVHQDWICAGGLIPILAHLLICSKGNIKKMTLASLQSIAAGNTENKEEIAETGALQCVVRSLARDLEESKQAVALLLELSRNPNVCQQIGRVQGCILLLVAMLNCGDPHAARDASELLNILSDDSHNVIQMAECNYFKPPLQCLSEGSDKMKILMASALAKMELTEQSKAALGCEGAIAPLVSMVLSEKFEAKLVALRALQRLSTLPQNTQYMINTGLAPHLLQLLFSVTSAMVNLKEPAAAILENLTNVNSALEHRGNLYGVLLENDDLIGQLLSLLNTTQPIIQGHLLRTLTGIACLSAAYQVRTKMRESGAIQLLLPFLSANDTELRTTAVQLLFLLSEHGSGQVFAEKLGESIICALVNILSESLSKYEQSAVLGILSNFPVHDSTITKTLLEADTLHTIIRLLKIESTSITKSMATNQIMENAAGVLIRFTLPSNKKTQSLVVEYGAMPLLLHLIEHGTPLAKSRAATSLAQLSQSSLALTSRISKGHSWFCLSPRSGPICKVHGGHCSIKTSFCLVKAGAIPVLFQVLGTKDREADEAILSAIASVICEDTWESAVALLEQADGIVPITRILTIGSVEAQEKALWISERVF